MSTMTKGSNFLLILVFIAIIASIVFMITPDNVVKTPKKQVTQIYFAENITTAHRTLISKFNKENAGKIEVVPVNLSFDKFSTNDRKELLTRTLRSKNNRIDIFTVDLIWVQRFAKWAEPLDSYFNENYRKSILDNAMESCYSDCVLVAMPFYSDIDHLYFRRDLLEKLPDGEHIIKKIKSSMEWDEFIELQKRLMKDTHQSNYVFPAENFEGLVCQFFSIFYSAGGNFLQNGKITVNTPEAFHALKLLYDLIHTNKITSPNVLNLDSYSCNAYCLDNNIAVWRSWPGIHKQLVGLPGAQPLLAAIDIAPHPHVKGGAPTSIYGGWNLMISKHSKSKKEAIKFLRFLLHEENQKILHQLIGFLPVSRSLYEDEDFLASSPFLPTYRDLIKFGAHRPAIANYTKISDILSYHIHECLKNEMSPEEALNRAQELITSEKIIFKE